jgi:hypothetical protein
MQAAIFAVERGDALGRVPLISRDLAGRTPWRCRRGRLQRPGARWPPGGTRGLDALVAERLDADGWSIASVCGLT